MGVELDLAGRRALVTGAGQGVGAGIAAVLAATGAEVVVNDVDAGRAEAAAERIVAAGGRAVPLAFDVTDHAAVTAAITGLGRIDVLVNNAGNAGTAGFGAIKPFTDTSPADWQQFLAVNLLGVMSCVHAVLPAMTAGGWGRIITIVSDSSRTGDAQMAPYAAAKAGAAGFSRSIATEVARYGITVNAIALGTIKTEATAAFWDDPAHAERHRAMLGRYLVRRPGDADDVAWIVAMLASPRSAWTTGQTIPVNGGYSFAL